MTCSAHAHQGSGMRPNLPWCTMCTARTARAAPSMPKYTQFPCVLSTQTKRKLLPETDKLNKKITLMKQAKKPICTASLLKCVALLAGIVGAKACFYNHLLGISLRPASIVKSHILQVLDRWNQSRDPN